MSDDGRELRDVPPASSRASRWIANVVLFAIYLYVIVAPTTRRSLGGQDGPVWQIAYVVLIVLMIALWAPRIVRALKARRNAKL